MFTNWHPGEPSGGDEHNLMFRAELGAWNDALGRNKYRFMCEWQRPRPDPFRGK